MPILPSGGLSIFLNLTIIFVGFIIESLKKMDVNLSLLYSFFSLITAKKYNTLFRKSVGYAVAFSIFAFMSVTTSLSIYNRIHDDSNYDLLVYLYKTQGLSSLNFDIFILNRTELTNILNINDAPKNSINNDEKAFFTKQYQYPASSVNMLIIEKPLKEVYIASNSIVK